MHTRTDTGDLSPDPQTRLVAGIGIAISVYISIVLWYMRASVGNQFDIPVFRHLILFQDFYALLPFIAILILGLLAPIRVLGTRAAVWCGSHVWAVAIFVAAALAIGTSVVYHSHPLSMDEYTAVFQSIIFSEGRLTGQFPPDLLDWLSPPGLQGRFMRVSAETGTAVSGYWPGFSLLLTPFTLLGIPWLLNPLIGGATIVVMHRLALMLFDSIESAGYVVLLTLASPAFTINALSFYAMPAHLLASALFMALLLRPTPPRAFFAGLIGSLALVLHNPVPHLLFAAPWVLWLFFRSDRVKILGCLLAGYLPLSLVLGWGWTFFLQAFSQGSTTAAVFSPGETGRVFLGTAQSALGWPSVAGMQSQLLGFCKLWIWAVPGLLLIAAVGAWRLRKRQGYWRPMIGSALLTYFAFFLVPFDQGHGWGFRYFHSAWLVLPLLAAAATQAKGSGRALQSYLSGCAILSLALLTTLSALQTEHFIARHLSQIPVASKGDSRVFIMNPRTGYYTWDLAQNDPFLRNPVIRLVSRNSQLDREMMAKHFPQYQLLNAEQRGTVWGIAPP
jgi:hypothetical protein